MSGLNGRNGLMAAWGLVILAWAFPNVAQTEFTGVTRPAVGGMSFQERVSFMERIDAVYAAHRATGGAGSLSLKRPSLDSISAAARRKAADALDMSVALEVLYNRAITPAMLQAELDRMGRETKAPEVLRELIAAAGNDPYTAAEILARPALADRFLRAAYNADAAFNPEAREAARQAMSAISGGASWEDCGGRHAAFMAVHGADPEAGKHRLHQAMRYLNNKEWEEFARHWPRPGAKPALVETPDAFVILRDSGLPDGSVRAESLTFPKRSFKDWWAETHVRFSSGTTATAQTFPYHLPAIREDAACPAFSVLVGEPAPRSGHIAFWTGSEMLFWGGDLLWSESRASGGAYDPATDTWRPMAMSPWGNAGPTGGFGVWTGRELVIIIGSYWSDEPQDGARYDPASDTWTRMSACPNCPGVRDMVLVWTGSTVIMWGASMSSPVQAFGARYDPVADSWNPMTASGAPEPRLGARGVWTGSEMIVWGGENANGQTLQSGGCYNPVTDTWRPTSEAAGMPEAREKFTAVWTGTEMIVWGGQASNYDALSTGARYNPSSDTWTPITTAGAPDFRYDHTAVWTGSEMVIWGGHNRGASQMDSETPLNTGARYSPEADSWVPTSLGTSCPAARDQHTAVWTGTEMIIWGGLNESNLGRLATGARYSPNSDSWTPMSMGQADLDDMLASGVWTGAEYIVWGGQDMFMSPKNTGAAWNPATAIWRPLASTSETPSPRIMHSAAWTGTEMIAWGGSVAPPYDQPQLTSTGGRYDPMQDVWQPTSTSTGTPTPRILHTSVWDGEKVIVWGGEDGNLQCFNSGGAYDPVTDLWFPLSEGPSCPAARSAHSAIWTGDAMIVWGGGHYDSGDRKYLGDGALYDSSSDKWVAIPAGNGAPPPLVRQGATWTGNSMLVWGESADAQYPQLPPGVGSEYIPAWHVWRPMATGASCPPSAGYPFPTWTGSRMFVLGALVFSDEADTASLYDPESGAWEASVPADQMPWLNSIFAVAGAGSQVILYQGYDLAGWLYRPCLTARAVAGWQTIAADYTVAFLGSAGGGYTPFSYDWDFGDGSPHGTAASPQHVYAGPGAYTYSLTVTDAHGTVASDTGSLNLTQNALPAITKVQQASAPFRLVLMGSGFQKGAVIDINGTPVPRTAFKSATRIEALKGNALKAMLPVKEAVLIRVTNPDGAQAFANFTR